MALPPLSNEPQRHPQCCLSMSTGLINNLVSQIVLTPRTEQGPILSIGSGSGFVEAYLLETFAILPQDHSHHGLLIEGVEVSSPAPMNEYLPEECTHIVNGTWDLCSRAEAASTLLFIYPRTPTLLYKYLEAFVKPEGKIVLVVWLGPRADWVDFGPCLDGLPGFVEPIVIEDCGLAEYEMMSIVRKIVT